MSSTRRVGLVTTCTDFWRQGTWSPAELPTQTPRPAPAKPPDPDGDRAHVAARPGEGWVPRRGTGALLGRRTLAVLPPLARPGRMRGPCRSWPGPTWARWLGRVCPIHRSRGHLPPNLAIGGKSRVNGRLADKGILLYGKRARTVIIHELWRYHKTEERGFTSEWVLWYETTSE